MSGREDSAPDRFGHIAVDDADGAGAATGAACGTVVRTPRDVPGAGRIAIAGDAPGAAAGLWTQT